MNRELDERLLWVDGELEDAFQSQPIVTTDGATTTLTIESIGTLKLPTGRIGAIEPFAIQVLYPFTISVPRGEYPVSVALMEDGIDRRIAFSRVSFASGKVDHWQLALQEGFNPSTLKPGDMVGYPVDGGTGSFLDEATAAYIATLDENEGFNKSLLHIIDQPHRLKEPMRTLLDAGSGNVAVFATGIGDGVYPSYFGMSADGKPVALVTDFGLVEWRK